MVDQVTDIAAESDRRDGIGTSIPPAMGGALAIMAHAGLSIGIGLFVGGLAGGIIGTGVGLIWFWGPPLALAVSSSRWMRDLADWDRPGIGPIRQRPHEPEPPREDASTDNGSAG